MKTERSFPWVLVFVIYFLVHTLIRTALGWQLTDDEAALLVQTNAFNLLYDGQLPLYVWIQIAAFKVFGVSILAFALVKNVILFLTCLCIFKMVERNASAEWALFAVISLLFIPQIAWSSQHGLTAPVLATLFVVATMLMFTTILRKQTMMRYFGFGVIVGLGLISEYCYLWLLFGLVLTALTGSRFRHVLINKWILLSITAAVAIAAAPYAQLFKTISMADFFQSGPILSSTFIIDRVRSVYHVLQYALAFTGFLIVGASFAVYSGLGKRQELAEKTADLRDLLTRSLSFGLLSIFAYVFVTNDAAFSLASLQPLMVLAGPITAIFIYPAIDLSMVRKAGNFAIGTAVIILLSSPAYYSFKAQTTFGVPNEMTREVVSSRNNL